MHSKRSLFFLPSPTFCIFDVIFYIFMLIPQLLIIAIAAFIIFLSFNLYTNLFKNLQSLLYIHLFYCDFPLLQIFSSTQQRLLNICFRVGLVLLNPSFCLSEFFSSPSILNNNLSRQSMLGCMFFPFCSLNISCHSILACKASAAKSADNFMAVSLYITFVFLLLPLE